MEAVDVPAVGFVGSLFISARFAGTGGGAWAVQDLSEFLLAGIDKSLNPYAMKVLYLAFYDNDSGGQHPGFWVSDRAAGQNHDRVGGPGRP